MNVDRDFVDGDSEADAQREYSALGYELLLPDQVLSLNRAELKRIAAGVTAVFDEVYRRSPTLSAERTGQLIDDVASGRVLLFTLRDRDGSVVATSAFTRVEPIFPDSLITSYEVGRTAKMPGTPKRLAARLLRMRFIWAGGNLGKTDYLLAHARVARAQVGRPHHGGVLGRLVERHFIPTHAVYSNYVAQTAAEPFVWLCAPINSASWLAEVRQQEIHLIDDTASHMFGAMLAESIEARISYSEPPLSGPPTQSLGIHELVEPSATSESLYVIADHPLRSRRALREIPAITNSNGVIASTGLSDKVIVEQDVISRAEAVHTLDALYQLGFHLAGWAPSNER